MQMKVLVAMSGGVDSSVCAALLSEKGYDCIGCTMKLYNNEDAGISKDHTCCSLADVEDARSVAMHLGIPYYVFNFTSDFKKKIIDRFVSSYLSGETPNPCIDCNKYMKFDRLFDRADLLDCRYIATGHYARIEEQSGKYLLKKALDPTKDQSYVLYSMTQKQLSRTLFPLGGLCKSEVRELAGSHGFINAGKPDSQDICFVPDGDYAKVIELHTGKPTPVGNFIDKSGNVLGRHNGIIRYTVGQHKKLGIPLPGARYVCEIRPETNEIILGEEKDLYSCTVKVGNINWIAGEPPANKFKCSAKLRYRQPEKQCTITVESDGTVTLTSDEPQRAVTPGQAAVFYDGDIVLGGGTIMRC